MTDFKLLIILINI